MNAALASFILGYHGCDAQVADQVVTGRRPLRASQNDYDWLGDGVYFWEHSPQRAFDFAKTMRHRPHPSGQRIRKPGVIGAVINLDYCLNLLDATFIELVRQAHADFAAAMHAAGEPLPRNTGGGDMVSRKLDCAVIRFLHQKREREGLRAFDTVRAAFFEGRPLYEGAGFAAGNHIQLCVRNPRCVAGYFHPLDEAGKPMKFS